MLISFTGRMSSVTTRLGKLGEMTFPGICWFREMTYFEGSLHPHIPCLLRFHRLWTTTSSTWNCPFRMLFDPTLFLPQTLCPPWDRNIYYILQEDDGTWKTGTIISDRSVRIYSFSEDINVRNSCRNSCGKCNDSWSVSPRISPLNYESICKFFTVDPFTLQVWSLSLLRYFPVSVGVQLVVLCNWRFHLCLPLRPRYDVQGRAIHHWLIQHHLPHAMWRCLRKRGNPCASPSP